MATNESTYSQSLTAMIVQNNAAGQQTMANAATQARYPKTRERQDMHFSVSRVANGYVLRLTEGYGEMVSSGNTFVASDIKGLGDLFISAVVNNELDK